MRLWACLAVTAALVAGVSACDVCSGASLHEGHATEVVLPPEGDLSSCACSWVFVYAAGPTPGRVALTATPGVGRITVYGDAAGNEVIAELPEAAVADGVALYSRTGTLRVDVAAVEAPPAGASVSISVEAISTPPIVEEHPEALYDPWFGTYLQPLRVDGNPLLVSLQDYDLGALLRVELAVWGYMTLVSVPDVPGVVFEFGRPDVPMDAVIISGPAEAVQVAVNNARLVPDWMFHLALDWFLMGVTKVGPTGEVFTDSVELAFGLYPEGVIHVPRGEQLVNSGVGPPVTGTTAVFHVHDVFQLSVLVMDLYPDREGGCLDFVRVWDGPIAATGRLLSTELLPTGEVCVPGNEFLPTYTSMTGELVVEFVASDDFVSLDTQTSSTPRGFQVWLIDDNRSLEAAVNGAPVLIPQIMVTSLPDPSEIFVNITASSGAVSLRFGDSFADVVVAQDQTRLSLAVAGADGSPAMLRMSDALAQVQFSAASHAETVVRLEAWSGGVAATPLDVPVGPGAVAINAPTTLAVHAFRPVAVPVTVDAAGTLVVEVSVQRGLGHVSIDPRAALWVDVGYEQTLAVTGTAAEVNAALASLVYKATLGGGTESILVVSGSAERRIAIQVDADCDGTYIIYGREGTVTERAGPPADEHANMECTWLIYGARELRFPYYEIHSRHIFSVADADSTLFQYPGTPSGVLRSSPGAFFRISFDTFGWGSSRGFVGAYSPNPSINDPPLLVVPETPLQVVRGSVTQLSMLFVSDFDQGAVVVSLETDAGSLGSAGSRLVEVEAATFEDLDALVTGITFVAGEVQTTATLTLRARDSGGAESAAQFAIEVLPCSGTAEVQLVHGSATAVVSDGSGAADYVDGQTCGWRLTGAPAPAVLSVDILDLSCSGDAITVYDGSSAAGRMLGSFCQADEVAAEVGTLVSSTGSFFLSLSTNADGAVDSGFSLVYGAVAAGAPTTLAAVPHGIDGERTDATVLALDESHLLVFGGHNGARSVGSTLVFDVVGAGWFTLAASGDVPPGRSRAAGAAVSATQIVVHGGVDPWGTAVNDTFLGAVDAATGTVAWVRLARTGPATAAAAIHVHLGWAHLVDATGVYRLGPDNVWAEVGSSVTGRRDGPAIVATSSAYRAVDGLVYAAAEDGAIWALSLETGTWTALGAALGEPCAAWTCSGAMLGRDEYAAGGWRVNVSSGAVDVLSATASGQTVGGAYLGQPAVYVYADGAVMAVALTLTVSGHAPRVSPASGGTRIEVAGEQLSTCAGATCEFGPMSAPATTVSERAVWCQTPGGNGTTTVAVVLACADGRRYRTDDAALVYFAEPVIDEVIPPTPDPGETVTLSLSGISADVLAMAEPPACRFGDAEVAGALDGVLVRCAVPATLQAGARVTVEVSLDGQQFGSARTITLRSASASSTSSSSVPGSIIVIIALVGAVVVAALGAVIARYRRMANKVMSGPAPWEISFDALELFEVLGSGGFGDVHRGRFRGGEVAVKVTKADQITDAVIAAFRKESALMSELRHPNIVLFMGACTQPPSIAIVLEFLPNGTLFDLLHTESIAVRFEEQLAFARDIVKGMAYLHAADPPIVHRDLKSLNVLVDKSWNLKVSDFGLTEIFSVGDADRGDGTTAHAGSVYWSAPEVLRGGAGDTASDVYSFGVTLWEICTRELPYDCTQTATVVVLVAEQGMRPSAYGPHAEPPFRALIDECWHGSPERRPSFAALQVRLSELSALRDGTSEATLSAPPSLVKLQDLDETSQCAVVVRLVGAAALWENDPVATREMLGAFVADMEELCTAHRGRSMPWEGETTACAFETATGALAFVMAVQSSDLASHCVVACGIGMGPARQQTDPLSRQMYMDGEGVVQARTLAKESVGGQILALRDAVMWLNVETLGLALVEIEGSDRVALYPEAHRDRHPAKQNAVGVAATDPSWVIDAKELEIGALIGAGSFGTVFKSTWKGTVVAAKQLHRKRLAAKEALDLQMESGVASKLRHPNVCMVLGVCKDTAANKLYVVSEYMSKGSVFDAIVTARKELAVRIKIKVAAGMALGLRYLHEQEPAIVHRSLSARNVLLSDGWTAKVSDFGLARVKDGSATMTKIGTSAYSAPEVIRGERYDEKADVYAYGVVVWEMLAQEVAWSGKRMGAVVEAVVRGERPPVMQGWLGAEGGVGQLIGVVERCWSASPEERPSMADVGLE